MQDLIKKLLEKKPKNRIKLDQILNHEWFHINLKKTIKYELNEQLESF